MDHKIKRKDTKDMMDEKANSSSSKKSKEDKLLSQYESNKD